MNVFKKPRRLIGICLLLVSSGFLSINASAKVAYDKPVNMLDGSTIQLADIVGKKPVYLKLWASWCQPCMQQMPHLQHAYEQYADHIEFLTINININETREDIDKVIKRFGLTVPIALDNDGALAHAYQLIGTPYHVLLNKQGDIVHKGHEADGDLDRKLALLAADNGADIKLEPLTDNSGQQTSLADIKQTDGIVMFTATWCDWYLAETRPAMSKACIDGQHAINDLQQQNAQLHWYGVVNNLWTGETDLAAYQEKYQVKFPLAIDHAGDAFFSYGIRQLPTVIIFKDGEERYRTTAPHNNPQLQAAIKQWLK